MMSFRFLMFAIVGLFCLHPVSVRGDTGTDSHNPREVCLAKADLAATIAAHRDEGKTFEAVRGALITAGLESGLELEHIIEWVMFARVIYSSEVPPSQVFEDVRIQCFSQEGISDA